MSCVGSGGVVPGDRPAVSCAESCAAWAGDASGWRDGQTEDLSRFSWTLVERLDAMGHISRRLYRTVPWIFGGCFLGPFGGDGQSVEEQWARPLAWCFPSTIILTPTRSTGSSVERVGVRMMADGEHQARGRAHCSSTS